MGALGAAVKNSNPCFESVLYGISSGNRICAIGNWERIVCHKNGRFWLSRSKAAQDFGHRSFAVAGSARFIYLRYLAQKYIAMARSLSFLRNVIAVAGVDDGRIAGCRGLSRKLTDGETPWRAEPCGSNLPYGESPLYFCIASHRQRLAFRQRFLCGFFAVVDQGANGSVVRNERIKRDMRPDHGVAIAESFDILA
jgi:hypothetical protein